MVAEINQRALISDFIDVLNKFRQDEAFAATLRTLQDADNLKPYFRSWLAFATHDNVKIFTPKVARKRGPPTLLFQNQDKPL